MLRKRRCKFSGKFSSRCGSRAAGGNYAPLPFTSHGIHGCALSSLNPRPTPVPNIRVLAGVGLGLLLFVATLGIGYLIWSVQTWGSGQTPVQRMLGLRCVDAVTGQVPGRRRMASRQVLGWCLNGQLLMGLFLALSGSGKTSVGDLFMGTIVLRDPDGTLLGGPGQG